MKFPQLTLLIIFSAFLQKYVRAEINCGERVVDRRVPKRYTGIVQDFGEGRIVGGEPAMVGDFPFIVSLQTNKNHFCGGSIISEEWILTAAHCAKDSKGNTRDIKVRAGTMTPSKGSIHKVVKIVMRPEFTYETYKADMSLMKVSPPFVFTRGRNGIGAIAPICFPDPDEKFHGKATVAGWGYHYSGQNHVSNKLMALEVNILEPEDCHVYSIFTDDFMICAGFLGGKKDACQGDSGGPLVVQADNQTVQIGIVSYGEGCADVGKPGVYTNVAKLVPWIEKITGIGHNDD